MVQIKGCFVHSVPDRPPPVWAVVVAVAVDCQTWEEVHESAEGTDRQQGVSENGDPQQKIKHSASQKQ
jgi:hypothetical protein